MPIAAPLPLAQIGAEQTPIEQLDPPTRAIVLMALFALVLLGLGMILLTMIGARWARRGLRDRKPPRRWPSRIELHSARSSQGDSATQQGSHGETLACNPGEQDTHDDTKPDTPKPDG